MKDLKELKYLTEIFDQINLGFVITDPNLNDNPIIFVNDYIEKLTGYEKSYFIGRNCRFLQNMDNNQESLDILRESLKKHDSCVVQLRNYKKDNELFINELFISPIFENEELKYYIGVQKDITLEFLLKEKMYTKSLIQEKELSNLNSKITNLLNKSLENLK